MTVTVSSATGNGSGTGTASSQYLPGTPDIAVWNGPTVQVWAPVNAGATEVYSGQSVTLANSAADGGPTAAQKAYMGAYYQWGRNDDVTTGTSTGTLAPAGTSAGGLVGTAWSGAFITSWTNPYDWIATQNGNLWGGSWSTTATGTFASLGSPAAMRGPCADGYHVPTQKEWCDAIFAVSPTRSGGAAMTCEGSWQVEATANKFMTTLRLPLAGNRNRSTAAFYSQGTYGYYWASSTSGTYGNFVNLSSTLGVSPASNSYRAIGFSVRCLAN